MIVLEVHERSCTEINAVKLCQDFEIKVSYQFKSNKTRKLEKAYRKLIELMTDLKDKFDVFAGLNLRVCSLIKGIVKRSSMSAVFKLNIIVLSQKYTQEYP